MSTFYTEPTTGTSIATDVVGNLRFQQFKLDIGGPGASVAATGTVANGLLVDVSRIQGGVSVTQGTTPWTVSGGVSLGSPIPPGANIIGKVSQDTSPWLVSGGVSLGSPLPPGPNLIGSVNLNNQPTINQGVLSNNSFWSVSGQVSVTNTPTVNQGTSPWITSGGVTVSNFPATQTVAGTTTANQGVLANNAYWSVSGQVSVTQTTTPWTVSGGVSLGSPLPPGSNTIGTVTANQGTPTWAVSGSVTLGSSLPAGTNIIGKVSQDTSPWVVGGTAASGSLVVGPPVTVAGADASGNVRTVLTDTLGRPVVNQGSGAAPDGSWLVSGGVGIAGTEGLASTKNIHGYTSVAVFDERVRRLLEELLSVLPGSEAERENRFQRLVTAAHGVQPQPSSVNSFAPPIASVHGIPFVMSGHPNLQTLRVNYTAAQTNAVIVTPNYNQMVVVTSVELTLDKAASVNVQVLVGTGTTVTPSGAGVITSHPGIDPGGGLVKGNGGGIIGIGNDGDPLRITCSAPTGGSLDVVVSYFCIEG